MDTNSQLSDIIDRTRSNLLDLSLRNRLLNTPRSSTKSKRLDIVDERSDDVFRILVCDQRAMTFLPGRDEKEDANEATAPAGLEIETSRADDNELLERYTDTRLQTKLTLEQLQTRLLSLYYDAVTSEEEQGVSILYLACGFLEWYESPSSDQPRFAPLILIPVDLERPTVTDRFRLKYREGDIATNLSLQGKLAGEFSIALPDVNDGDENLVPSQYYSSVTAAVSSQPRWLVHADDMTLWFFSFAKYLMYRDLDPASWPASRPLTGQPLIRGLLQEGFRGDPPLCGDDDPIDGLIAPAFMTHVTDADSSQSLVIEEVRQGRHLVVQGPPGTGKSQTITNLIATAVKEGKKILFVAEKLAALEVVKSRLDRLGIGPVGLELHSNKANKRMVLEELGKTLDLGRPKVHGTDTVVQQLTAARDALNAHTAAMNAPIEPAAITPYQLLGEMTKFAAGVLLTPTFLLPNPEIWSKAEVEDRSRRLTDFMRHARDLGSPSLHPWRGVRRTLPLLPSDLDGLRRKIEQTLVKLNEAEVAYRKLSELMAVRMPDAPTFQVFQTLHQLGEWVAALPEGADRKAMAGDIWNQEAAGIASIVNRGPNWVEDHNEVDAKVARSGWDADVGNIRRAIAGHGRSWLRWLNSDYRRAVAEFRGLLSIPVPKDHAERLKLLDSLLRVKEHRQSFASGGDEKGRIAFGTVWQSRESDWALFQRLVEWDARGREQKLSRNRGVLPKVAEPQSLLKFLPSLHDSMRGCRESLDQIAAMLELKYAEAFGFAAWNSTILSALRNRLEEWRDSRELLSQWIAYSVRFKELQQYGLGELLKEFVEGRVTPDNAVTLYRQAYCEAVLRHVWQTRPGLTRFDGKSHGNLVEEFKRLDLERIALARAEVAAAHFAGMPHDADRGEMSILRNEISKKRRHMPIRKLLKQAGHAVQAIKPLFMMSPISIAQFLEPGQLEFDIMIMDEASQVPAEDALGAVARAKQIVVVGDSKQLPPTRFFNKVMEDSPAGEDDESFNTGDIESVLGLCLARGLPQRMLRWHYRSRHHSLIAVSNREFYDHKLCVIPSPITMGSGYGLQMQHIKDGVFDRGGKSNNVVEARAVANAILEHARQSPLKSLGVGTFSVAQRDAILDELELLRRQSPGTENFFNTSKAEPFFVKNLENIQGEERDIIFISIGYARDSSGFMAMSFGPLTADGGERRLNVLISRAKERCVVFSSITHDDIDLTRAKTVGPRALKVFLRFAATGEMDTPTTTGAGFDSEFERQVAEALQLHGHTVHNQIGTAGFLIDLAVVDPETPGRYLLAIECDGATYHSSRWARDRDRLREQVLRDRGWQVHRIWSTDWFHRRDEQLRKTLAAIEAAQRFGAACEPPVPIEPVIERDDDAPSGDSEIATTPYTEAEFEVPKSASITDIRVDKLAEFARRVIEIEGPVFRGEVARRLCTLWGYSRLGSRIEEAVERSVEYLLKVKSVIESDGFMSIAGQQSLMVRSRSGTRSPGLRKPEFLPPAEVAEAVQQAVTRNIGSTREEVIVAVARSLGFASTTAKLREAIEARIAELLVVKAIEARENRLYLQSSTRLGAMLASS